MRDLIPRGAQSEESHGCLHLPNVYFFHLYITPPSISWSVLRIKAFLCRSYIQPLVLYVLGPNMTVLVNTSKKPPLARQNVPESLGTASENESCLNVASRPKTSDAGGSM